MIITKHKYRRELGMFGSFSFSNSYLYTANTVWTLAHHLLHRENLASPHCQATMDDLASQNRRLTLECANMYAVQEVCTTGMDWICGCDGHEGECEAQKCLLREGGRELGMALTSGWGNVMSLGRAQPSIYCMYLAVPVLRVCIRTTSCCERAWRN